MVCASIESGWNYYDGLMVDGDNCSNIAFENCTAHNSLRHGVQAHSAANVTVTGGQYHDNSQKYGTGVGFNGVLAGTISGVTSYGNHYGVKAANWASDILIEGNSTHHNVSFGIDLDMGVQNSRVEANETHDNGSHGIAVEIESSNCIVTRNLCYRNGPEAAGIFVETASNIIVSYNMIHDEYIGLRFNERATNGAAYNNVVYNIAGVGFSAFNECTGIVFKNNIAQSCPYRAVHVRADSQVGFVSDFNNWYATGEKLRWGSDSMGFAEWQSTTGQDAHSLSADPRFVDPAKGDFHLQPDSPCVDAATDVGLTVDYEGAQVPQGAGPDIGALESGPGNAPPMAFAQASPTSGAATLEVQFDATGSYDPDGTIVSYAWGFGDEQAGSGPVVSHQYATSGTFAAILTVTDDAGATGADSVAIVVEDASPGVIFVADIEMSLIPSRRRVQAAAKVSITDGDGQPVPQASVSGFWSGVVSGSGSGTSGEDGTVTMLSIRTKRSGAFTFTVTDVRAEGFSYDPDRNAATSGSISYVKAKRSGRSLRYALQAAAGP